MIALRPMMLRSRNTQTSTLMRVGIYSTLKERATYGSSYTACYPGPQGRLGGTLPAYSLRSTCLLWASPKVQLVSVP